MPTLGLVLFVSAVVLVIVKVRADASRSRKEVLARLSEEKEVRGDYSPTAELFREVGVPVPESLVGAGVGPGPAPSIAIPSIPNGSGPQIPTPSTAPTAAGATAVAPSHRLTDVFAGIRMPAELAPLGEMTPSTASFVTRRGAREVHDGLAAELARLGAHVSWAQPGVALVVRDGRAAVVTLHARPDTVRDLDGALCFPTATPDGCVVRMSVA